MTRDDEIVKDAEPAVLTTLIKGLEMLEAVGERLDGATAKDLARALDIKLGACYHLLRTLTSRGYLEKETHGVFRVGPRSLDLSGKLSEFESSPETTAILMRLNNRTRETSYMCGWHHGAIRIQQQIPGAHALTVKMLSAGYAGNMHARASCLAILAYLPPKRIATIFSGLTLEQLTSRTITDYDELVDELAATRARGYAVDHEAFQLDICCVSAPYFDGNGSPIGSYTVAVPKSRYESARASLIAAVLETGDLATKALTTPRMTLSPKKDGSVAVTDLKEHVS